jgi:hypothetical protein
MGIFIVYIIYLQSMFLVLNYINIWFELIIQKTFEMKIFKMAHIVIFHLKMIVCQNFNLPCIYGQCPKKCDMIIIKLFTWLINLNIE